MARSYFRASQEDLEVLNAPSDEEIAEATLRVTDAARSRFTEAAFALSIAKFYSGDRTPWRELIAAYRQTQPMRTDIEVVDDDGVPRVQVAYIHHGHRPKIDKQIFEAVAELARAIELIERERARHRMHGSAGGRPSFEDASSKRIAAWLKRRGYTDSQNKKRLVIDAMAHFDVKKTKVTDAITKHGLARSRAK